MIRPMTLSPWRFFLLAIAGWMNKQQRDLMAYLIAENRILREKLGGKRILLDGNQKSRLAAAAAKVGPAALCQITTLFSPDTIVRWNRMLIARKYDGSGKRGPPPKKANSVRKLVLQMAEANPSWGYPILAHPLSWHPRKRTFLTS
jgi:hypothetical protein